MLFERQKSLLALVDALGGRVANTDFQKLLFLWSQAGSDDGPGFDFVPYRYGAFSFTSYADRRKLIDRGLLAEDDSTWSITDAGKLAIHKAKAVRSGASAFASTAPAQRGDALVALTYRKVPFFAVRSEIVEQVLCGDASAQAAVEAVKPQTGPAGIVTVGYEGRSLEAYLVTLLRGGVTLLCDVRRNPVSRRYGFAKSTLGRGCEQVGIRYEHVPRLGIASARRKGLHTQADYDALFREYVRDDLPRQTDALGTIVAWVNEGHRVALTCFERQPEKCHRRCVAEALEHDHGPRFEPVHL